MKRGEGLKENRKVMLVYFFEEHQKNWTFVESYINILTEHQFTLTVVTNRIDLTNSFSKINLSILNFSNKNICNEIKKIVIENQIELVLSIGDWPSQAVSNVNSDLNLPGASSKAVEVSDCEKKPKGYVPCTKSCLTT